MVDHKESPETRESASKEIERKEIEQSQQESADLVDQEPRTYTILYARPHDQRLTGDDSVLSDSILEESYNSNFNSLLSDYSFGANSERNASSEDSLLDDYSSATGEMDESNSSLLSFSKIKSSAFANWTGPKDASSLDAKDVHYVLQEANRVFLKRYWKRLLYKRVNRCLIYFT